MKDEAVGMPIKEFIGLRSKMYSYHKSFSKIEELTQDTIEDIKQVAQRATIAHLSPMCQHPFI